MLLRLLLCGIFLLPSLVHAESGISFMGTSTQPLDKPFPFVNPQAPKGGTITFADLGNFDSLHSAPGALVPQGMDSPSLYLMAEGLATPSLHEPFTIYPLLAEKIMVDPQNRWAEATLNPKAKFSDGAPITVEDVIFSFKAPQEFGAPNVRTLLDAFEDPQIVGPNTVRFTLKNGAQDREKLLIVLRRPIYSKKDWEGKDFSKPTLSAPLMTGPYRISKVEAGRVVEYEKNPDYWGKDLPIRQGLFNADKIRFEYFKNFHIAFEAFSAGLVDFMSEVDPARWNSLYQGPNFSEDKVRKWEIPNTARMGARGFALNMRKDLFKDKRVRQALLLLWDFDEMNRSLFNDSMQRYTSFYQNSPYMAESLPSKAEAAILIEAGAPDEVLTTPLLTLPNHPSREDLKQAMSLLKEAGYVQQNGLLVKNGVPLAFEVLFTDAQLERTILSFKDSLAKVGIKVTPRLVDPTQYEKRRIDWDYDVLVNYWGGPEMPGREQDVYWSTKSANTPGQRNYMGLEDPVVDKLIARLPQVKTYEELMDTTRALDRMLQWHAILIPSFYPSTLYFTNGRKIGLPPPDAKVGIVPAAMWVVSP